MARVLFVLMLVLCAMFATRTQVGGAPSQSTLIVPGVQLGPIRIGMSALETLRILGRPKKTHTVGLALWEMDWGTFTVVFQGASFRNTVLEPGDTVVSVTTRSSKYVTRQGIRVGSPAVEVPVRLGPPFDHQHMWRDGEVVGGVLFYRGMRIEFAGKYMVGRVNSIAVDRL